MPSGRKGSRSATEKLSRAAMLSLRYGLSPDRLRAQLSLMRSCLARYDLTPSIPITAENLDFHPTLARDLIGIDVAIHGYQHVAYEDLTPAEQETDLDSALCALTRNGFTATVFRSPYLRLGDVTPRILCSRGISGDSSMSRMALPESHPHFDAITYAVQRRYPAIGSRAREIPRGLPIVELPVSLPDDEILLDALNIHNPSTLTATYCAMMSEICEAGSLFVLQVHPERFSLCREAIERVVKEAADNGAWLASLSETAAWVTKQSGALHLWPNGHRFALCVTGDLDAMTLVDFVRRKWRRLLWS